jgi:N-acetyl-gamma-glutamyl-phosphate reductase
MPLDQGILATCYLTVPGLGGDEAKALYREHYAGEPFVEVVDGPPHTRHVQDSNRCRVQVSVVGDRTIAFAAIDNLWKGAAGQAVQDLNLMLGLPEEQGLR